MECIMDHIVLNMEDDETMLDFYANVLQLATERLKEYRAGDVPFPSVRLDPNTIIDLFPANMWQKNAPKRGRDNLNHFCIALEKPAWDELRRRLAANDVDIEQGPVQRWGSHGTGISIYFRDPENNLIEARYYDADSDSNECLLTS